MQIFLVDNGSLRIESWENLVRTAAVIGRESNERVEAASLQHSERIEHTVVPEGMPTPQLLEVAMKRRLSLGERRFLILPFFIGPSRAITESLWKMVARLRVVFGWFEVQVAPFLGCPMDGETAEAGLAGLMVKLVGAVSVGRGDERVVLVDHGSPIEAVTAVRNRIGLEMGQLLGRPVVVSSMERREGAAYDFNEPLLVRALGEIETEGPVIVAMLFLSPGRHAGADGDVARICGEAEAGKGGLTIVRTALPGMEEGIVRLLRRRLRAAQESVL